MKYPEIEMSKEAVELVKQLIAKNMDEYGTELGYAYNAGYLSTIVQSMVTEVPNAAEYFINHFKKIVK